MPVPLCEIGLNVCSRLGLYSTNFGLNFMILKFFENKLNKLLKHKVFI